MLDKTAALPHELVTVQSTFGRESRLRRSDMNLFLPAATAAPPVLSCPDRSFAYREHDLRFDVDTTAAVFGPPASVRPQLPTSIADGLPPAGVLASLAPEQLPTTPMLVPQLSKLILDCGKLAKLDQLLHTLKAGGHRVLLYFQMTRMIDLMEEYLAFRQYKYLRLDGSSCVGALTRPR